MTTTNYIIGTSGYSFPDWVGNFYPAGMRRQDMFAHYAKHFRVAELNYTYYRMPAARTMESLAANSPKGYQFWVKANQETTHKYNRKVAGAYLDAIAPLADADKLAGVLLQFPQSFHRTVANRKYLAGTIADLAAAPLAVEFRHRSWSDPAVLEGLRSRHVTLVVPDSPPITNLYHSGPAATTTTGYVRLHSRNADKWYAGGAERYDYNYSKPEMQDLLNKWTDADLSLERMFVFFNNCHQGQAAQNAEAFQRIVDGLGRR